MEEFITSFFTDISSFFSSLSVWFFVIIGGVFLLVIFIYNRFITLQNRTLEAWSDVEVQFKRRYDLIPNLVETVKGYASHERETLAQVTEMRKLVETANTPQERGSRENMLSDTLKSLFAVSENYPDLKANQNFIALQQELTDTENKIQAARRFYNSTIQDYNTKIQQIPYTFFAHMFNFAEKDFFELNAEEKEKAEKSVSVSF